MHKGSHTVKYDHTAKHIRPIKILMLLIGLGLELHAFTLRKLYTTEHTFPNPYPKSDFAASNHHASAD